ncbi:MAG: VOC family protein [Planctomycetota bacterium]
MSAGKFCWHDLMSTDPDVSREFFTKLFGWTVSPMDMGEMGTYQMLMNGETGIGGIVPLDDSVPVPSHWIGYVTADDVDAALERGANHGGRTCVPGTDIPEVGRFGVLTDPSGAVISPFKSLHEAEEGSDNQECVPIPGSFCWNELLTDDVDQAKAFYGEVFGWSTLDNDMGEMGTYTLFRDGETDRGGMMTMPPNVSAPPHWLHYVLVADVDAKAGEVTDLGGNVFCQPTSIPGIGRFAVCSDPTGATFAIFKGAPKQG